MRLPEGGLMAVAACTRRGNSLRSRLILARPPAPHDTAPKRLDPGQFSATSHYKLANTNRQVRFDTDQVAIIFPK